MARELVTTNRNAHALTIPADLKAVREYVDASLAPNTRRAYRASLASFREWCEVEKVDALPASPETVAAFLAAEANAGLKPATLGQRVAAIRWAHEAAGQESPTKAKLVAAALKGIRRKLGVAPTRKAPATVDRLAAMVAKADLSTLKGKRDKALLLFGFASAMRRGELVALTVEDLEETKRGLLVTLRHSKTDQEGQGPRRAIPCGRRAETCPVAALNAWIEAAGISEGKLLRSVTRHGQVGESMSTRALADVVKHYAKQAKLNPDEYSGHSLRAGFVTSAAEKGRSTERIMDHTGHQSAAMVRVYTRRVDAFTDHAGEGLL
jgi:site-specific recombinase XerD